MSACAEVQGLLAARPLGLVEGRGAAALDAHLAACAACRGRLAALEGCLAGALPDDAPPADGWDRLRAAIEADRAGPALRVVLTCRYCHDGLDRREAAFCAACLAPHHEGCFREHGRCSAPGCGETRVVGTVALPARRASRLAWGLVATLVAGAAALAGRGGAERPAPGPGPTAAPPASGLELRVTVTSAERAGRLYRWLEYDPDSPIVSRRDLEAYVHGGSVRIRGFAREEPELLAHIRALVDPTGSGRTFSDAAWRRSASAFDPLEAAAEVTPVASRVTIVLPQRFELVALTAASPEHADEVVRWLAGDVGSPLSGRGDLRPYRRRGSPVVRVAGFRQVEPELLARVRATRLPDPAVVVTLAEAVFVEVGQDPVGLAEAAMAEGVEAYRLREWRRALEACDRAEKAVPSHPSAWTLRGHVHVALDEPDRAEKAYEVALASAPDHAPALAWRGELRARRGDLEGGLADARRACALEPEGEEPRRIRERLERLVELRAMQRQVERMLGDVAPETTRGVVDPPPLRMGAPRAEVERLLGSPEEEGPGLLRGVAVTELRYFARGLRVELDGRGVCALHLHGGPGAGRYRPAAWRVAGVGVGASMTELLGRLGPPDGSERTPDGERLRWDGRGLVVVVDVRGRVEAFRLEAAGY